MQWYYSKNGNQLGPISAEEIKSKLSTGEIGSADLVWKDGMADWVPASQVGELRSLVSSPTLATESSPGAPVSTQSPYSPPISVQGSAVGPGGVVLTPTCGKATTAMTLGICGLVFALCCPLAGIVLGILAIVFGNQAKQQIAVTPLWANDLGKAKNAVVMGWIAIPLAVVIGIASVVLQFGMSSMQHSPP